MSPYVEVAVNVPQVAGVFDYHLPDDLAAQVQPGSLVVVPFGQKTVQGIVTRHLDLPRVAVTRSVMLVVDAEPALTASQLKLGDWLSVESLSSLGVCLEMMLPPGLSQQADTLYSLNPGCDPDLETLSKTQQRLWSLLKSKGALRGRQLDAAFRRVNWRPSMHALNKKGFVNTEAILQGPNVRPKVIRTAQLAQSPEIVCSRIETDPALGRIGSPARDRRVAVLKALLAEPWPVDAPFLYSLTNANSADLEKLASLGLIQLGETEVIRDPLENLSTAEVSPPDLTQDQQAVWQQVYSALKTGQPVKPHILYGVTGSGKTEIYLRAVEEVLRQGKQAIVLVPEIALTPQTAQRFLARFPGQVGLVHHQLSVGERYDTWRRARAGQLNVIVGPRSALFAPLPRLGLIVVDECHEASYSQSDAEPRYSAVTAAVELARITGSLALFGSATPDVSMMYHAIRSGWPVLKLPVRVLAHTAAIQRQQEWLGRSLPSLVAEGQAASLPLPPVQVVDMRQELASGNRSIFSMSLQQSLQTVLDQHEQAILFLNRRGSATYVFCRACGHSLMCPRCDLPLTYHTGSKSLICHTCNYRRLMPATCPSCGSNQIRQFGAGTEKVEQVVSELFPSARVLRWDAETTRQKGAHDLILSHFSHRRADILVGTQMLAKGLDLPLVTLVGVVLADVGLNLPDFRAGERTFQLLTQVAGRAGRSPLGGRVILQTFQPENYAIRAAAAQDYRTFYQQEVERRRAIHYPPFARLVRLEYRSDSAEKAEREAHSLAARLPSWLQERGLTETDLIGPVPCFFARQDGVYRWQIIIRGPNPALVLRERSIPGWLTEVDPPDLL